MMEDKLKEKIENIRSFLPFTMDIQRVSSDGRIMVVRIRDKYLRIDLPKHIIKMPLNEIIRLIMYELSNTPIKYVSKEDLQEALQS